MRYLIAFMFDRNSSEIGCPHTLDARTDPRYSQDSMEMKLTSHLCCR